MKLSKKNLIYSLVLAGILMVFVIGYFILMLPSLYVSYVEEQNLNSIKKQHTSYINDGNYNEVSVNNPAGCYTFDIPLDEDYIYLVNKAMTAKIYAKDDVLKNILHQIQERMSEVKHDTSLLQEDAYQDELKEQLELWKEELSSYQTILDDLPMTITFTSAGDFSDYFSNSETNYHLIGDDTVVVESSVNDSKNSYTNYIAITTESNRFILSYLPVMTPEMNEILPVVLQSLPMIASVLILLVLLFSKAYSKGIVDPFVTLVSHTRAVRFAGIKDARVPEIKGCEEVSTLAQTLNELYEELRSSYTKLTEKNLALAEENERKEVFLRASSHQLKTPIAAALLLLDGMINQIGKYKDSAVYLPQVKQQLLNMKNIVDDILYLNHCDDHLNFQNIDLPMLMETLYTGYEVELSEKNIDLQVAYKEQTNCLQTVYSDYNLLSKVLDNLICNAVTYTPNNNTIVIHSEASTNTLEITNWGSHIDEHLLPHIFEPFVTGNHDSKYHGLGLYIVSYYAKKLHITIIINNVIKNGQQGVCASLTFTTHNSPDI